MIAYIIYIDPPYNTGSTDFRYEDMVFYLTKKLFGNDK